MEKYIVKVNKFRDVKHSLLRFDENYGVSLLEFIGGKQKKYNLALINYTQGTNYDIIYDLYYETDDKNELTKIIKKIKKEVSI